LPGNIIECGVFKGTSLIRFATFRDILEAPFSRKIIGFDNFGKFPDIFSGNEGDKEFIKSFELAAGNGISSNELKTVFENKKFVNFEFVEGDIIDTVPEYIDDHKELKIALLHIDVDVYAPSVVILENMCNKVVKGGVIVLDDYGTVAGETKAVRYI
jgi:hypothetical protein